MIRWIEGENRGVERSRGEKLRGGVEERSSKVAK
jgi:hypothetical protein